VWGHGERGTLKFGSGNKWVGAGSPGGFGGNARPGMLKGGNIDTANVGGGWEDFEGKIVKNSGLHTRNREVRKTDGVKTR